MCEVIYLTSKVKKVQGEATEFTCQHGPRRDYFQEYRLCGWFIFFTHASCMLSRISYTAGLEKATSLLLEKLVRFAKQVEKFNIWNGFCIYLLTFTSVRKIQTGESTARTLQNSHSPQHSWALPVHFAFWKYFHCLFTFAFPASFTERGPR